MAANTRSGRRSREHDTSPMGLFAGVVSYFPVVMTPVWSAAEVSSVVLELEVPLLATISVWTWWTEPNREEMVETILPR